MCTVVVGHQCVYSSSDVCTVVVGHLCVHSGSGTSMCVQW